MSDINIIVAGFGGQGVLFVGKILAYAAMMSGKKVSWLPSYGPEMRGGSANCHIVISDNEIGTPIITEADILIALSKPAFDKFKSNLKSDGIIFVDKMFEKYLPKDTNKDVRYIDSVKTAHNLGNESLSNMVMLGSVLRITNILETDEILSAIKNNIPKSKQELINADISAVLTGYEQIS